MHLSDSDVWYILVNPLDLSNFQGVSFLGGCCRMVLDSWPGVQSMHAYAHTYLASALCFFQRAFCA